MRRHGNKVRILVDEIRRLRNQIEEIDRSAQEAADYAYQREQRVPRGDLPSGG